VQQRANEPKAAGNNNSYQASAHRWVPPSRRGHVVDHGGDRSSGFAPLALSHQQQQQTSYQQQPKYSAPTVNSVSRQRVEEEKNVAFKKIRGVLNKLTPEKFDKLIGDILSVDLSSTDILKGVIILIFEKALYEPKYSSMYAQLCKRLDEKSPVDPNRNITIFKFHLLNQCKEEFENRSRANITFENGYEPTEEELEAKFLAKRKMLGNIKFIGELGKLQIVQDRILHMCCEALVLGWKNKPLSEQEEDLECLCHLMRTCGRILDTPNGKYRMDQYFERMDQVIEGSKMPLRIRFMIQDITELRRSKWTPRRAGKDPERGPRTIQQVREDAARDGFIYMPQDTSPPQKMSPAPLDLMYGNSPFDGVFNKRSVEDDFFGGFGGSGPSHGRTATAAAGSGSTASPAGYLTGGYFGTAGPGAIAAAAAGYGDHDEDIPGFPLGNKGPSIGGYKTNAMPTPQPAQQQQQQSMVVSRQPRPVVESSSPPPASLPPPPMQQQQQPQRHTRYNDLLDEPVINNNTADLRKDAGGDRERQDFDGGRPRRGGFRGGGEVRGHSERRLSDEGKPVPDFGDRYSANRSRDQQRRDRGGGGGGDWAANKEFPDHRGGRGGYRGRFENYRNNNNSAGPLQSGPRFNRGPSDDRFDASQPPPRYHHQQQQQQQQQPDGNDESNLNNLPPRFNKKMTFNGPPPSYQPNYTGGGRQLMGGQGASSKDVELSLRPASSGGNMVFKPKTPSLLPKSAIGSRDGSSPLGENSLLGPTQPQAKVMMQQKEGNILIKQGSLDGRAKKEKSRQAAANKGPTREQLFAKVNNIVGALLTTEETSGETLDAATASWTEDGWLPSKMTQTAVTQVYNVVLAEEVATNRRRVMDFLLSLIKDKAAIDATHCREAFTKVLNSADKEASKNADYEEKVSKVLAELAAWKVGAKLASLDEIADCVSPTINSAKLRKILLQTMSLLASSSSAGEAEGEVLALFNQSKIQLKEHVDQEEQSDAKMAHVLASYKLSFLKPMLFIHQDMSGHMQAHPGMEPEALLSWINSNVSAAFLSQPDFIIALYSVVLGHIVESTTLPKGADAATQPEKSLVESEKEKLAKFRGVLHSFVANKADLQLTAVYALQVYSHGLGFPKGLLLRAFVNCYEMDILDEHAFLQWKEDVNDFYPGKGQALFQVNQWLTWLEEAESEEEDEDDD